MKRYVAKRLLVVIPELFFIAVAVFTLLYLTPGDPASYILGDTATEAELQAYREYLGIDRPYLQQLGNYLYNLFIKWDLGKSWVLKTDILYEIQNRLPYSLAVGMFSIVVGVVTGVPMGIAAAVNQDKAVDRFVLLFTSIMQCIPNYVWAFVFIIIFALNLGWLPAYGVGGAKYFILPCACLTVGSFGSMARSMRSQMLEVIRSDFVVAAKAQGFSRNTVYYKYALSNALIPLITQLGNSIAGVLGGTMILETIFSIPGMGTYITNGVQKLDIPVVESSVIFMAVWYCLVMVVVDIMYAMADPRIKSQYEDQGGSHRSRRKKEKVKNA